MTAPALTLAAVRRFRPCSERFPEIEPALRQFGRRRITARQAVEAGVTFNDLVWVASAAAHDNKDIERRLRLWMSDCAARVLHIYERDYPADERVRGAIVAARQYARGEIDDAARDAARAAAWDAAARDAARAAARAAAWDAARDAEEKWQFDRLVARLSDPEPEDWQLPEPAVAKAA